MQAQIDAIFRRMTAIAKAMDRRKAYEMSDRMEQIMHKLAQGGNDPTPTPGGVQALEPTLRKKPVSPFLGEKFEDGPETDESDKKPEPPKKKKDRHTGLKPGTDFVLNKKSDGPKKPKKEDKGS